MTVLTRNLFFLTSLSLLWAWQLLLALSFILNCVPPNSSLAAQILPEWQYLFKPEWKPFIYHVVIMAGILFQVILIWVNRSQISTKDLFKPWKSFFALDAVLTFCWTSAAFKMIVYADRPDLARDAFVILFILIIFVKVFCDRWPHWFGICWQWCCLFKMNHRAMAIVEWSIPIILFVIVYVPNIQGLIAREFIGEQFHHMDGSMMGPAWGFVSGQTLDVNIISEYGIGIIAVVTRLTQLFGGFSYEHLLGVTVMATIIYYVAWYVLARRIFDSCLMALALILLVIKWQMFHPGVYPFVFTYTSATPMRFFYDVFYFWCLWMHIHTGKKSWLFGAAAACGFGIYYMTSEGLYGTASFVAYIALLMALPHWRKHFHLRLRDAAVLVLPFIVALILLALTIGSHILTHQFWNNMGEFINYFLSGFGLEPMTKTLLDHKYLESLMGFVIPVVYLLTLLIILSRLVLNEAEKQEWLMVVLCFYGLATFHYYVARSTGTSYYAVCLPYVLVLGYWVQVVINSFSENRRFASRLVFLSVVVWALVTNHMFLSYPNLVNASSHPLTDNTVALPLPAGGPYFNHLFRNFNPALKLPVNSLGESQEEILAESDFKDDRALVEYYHQRSDFSKDAQLIASLTAHSDEIPLISSFETSILMQANRKTFFYYFPLIISRPMSMRSFEVCSIYTTDQLAKTLSKFEQVKPPYVFMERIYMVKEVPQPFLFQYPSLIPLINYVRTHYAPYAQGEYLIALKRIP